MSKKESIEYIHAFMLFVYIVFYGCALYVPLSLWCFYRALGGDVDIPVKKSGCSWPSCTACPFHGAVAGVTELLGVDFQSVSLHWETKSRLQSCHVLRHTICGVSSAVLPTHTTVVGELRIVGIVAFGSHFVSAE